MADKQDMNKKEKPCTNKSVDTLSEDDLDNSSDDKSRPTENDLNWLINSLERSSVEDKPDKTLDNTSEPQPETDLGRSGEKQLENGSLVNELDSPAVKPCLRTEMEKMKKSAAMIVSGFGGLFSATGGLLYSCWIQVADSARSLWE